MNDQRKELNDALEAFTKDQSRENKVRMVNAMLPMTMIVPGAFPPGTDLSQLPKPSNPGEKVPIPKEMRPMPAVLRNKEGENYIPAYASPEELPQDPKPAVVLNIPFMTLVNMALSNPMILGIAVNPYKENILLKEPLLKALKEDYDRKRAAAGKGGIAGQPLTPAQAKAFFRRTVEANLIPSEFRKDPKAFTDRLCEEEGVYLRSIYERVYKNPADCPYDPSDMSVMALSIREGLLLIRVDLPSIPKGALNAERIYLLYAEEEGRTDYYMIERTPEKNGLKIGRVKPDGGYEEIGEAPSSGAELQRMLDLYDFYGKEELQGEGTEENRGEPLEEEPQDTKEGN